MNKAGVKWQRMQTTPYNMIIAMLEGWTESWENNEDEAINSVSEHRGKCHREIDHWPSPSWW